MESAKTIEELNLELLQLRHTVQALRAQLEEQQRQAAEQLHQQQVNALTELGQLQGSVAVLRQRLEQREADHREELQRHQAETQSQLRHLQEALLAQRQLLEAGGRTQP